MAIDKKPSIGELRNIGHFENDNYIQPYTAGYVDGYTNVVASVYCKIKQVHSRRVNDFGNIQIVSSWEMYCRFQEAINSSLLENTKFVQDGRLFTINGFHVIDEKNFYYWFSLNLISA